MPVAILNTDEREAWKILSPNGPPLAYAIASALAAERERCAVILDEMAAVPTNAAHKTAFIAGAVAIRGVAGFTRGVD